MSTRFCSLPDTDLSNSYSSRAFVRRFCTADAVWMSASFSISSRCWSALRMLLVKLPPLS